MLVNCPRALASGGWKSTRSAGAGRPRWMTPGPVTAGSRTNRARSGPTRSWRAASGNGPRAGTCSGYCQGLCTRTTSRPRPPSAGLSHAARGRRSGGWEYPSRRRLRRSESLCQNEYSMACYSGVSTVQRHGTALLESARLSRPVHLVLDAPWGFALWGLAELPRPTLVVTECPSPHYLRDLVALAPEGILATSAGPKDVLEGLREVAEGQSFHKLPALYPDALTAREREVMRRVSLGHADAEIACALGVSRRTVYNWVSSLQDKLALENRVQIALYYLGMLPHFHGWRSKR